MEHEMDGSRWQNQTHSVLTRPCSLAALVIRQIKQSYQKIAITLSAAINLRVATVVGALWQTSRELADLFVDPVLSISGTEASLGSRERRIVCRRSSPKLQEFKLGSVWICVSHPTVWCVACNDQEGTQLMKLNRKHVWEAKWPVSRCACNQYYCLASPACYFNQEQAVPLLIAPPQDECFTNAAQHTFGYLHHTEPNTWASFCTHLREML